MSQILLIHLFFSINHYSLFIHFTLLPLDGFRKYGWLNGDIKDNSVERERERERRPASTMTFVHREKVSINECTQNCAPSAWLQAKCSTHRNWAHFNNTIVTQRPTIFPILNCKPDQKKTEIDIPEWTVANSLHLRRRWPHHHNLSQKDNKNQ